MKFISAARMRQIGSLFAFLGAVAFGAAGVSVLGRASPPAHRVIEPDNLLAASAAMDASSVAPNGRSAHLIGHYAAIVTRVIDGDTVEARVAVWLGQHNLIKVRLRGIDEPEIRGACGSERDLALAARDRLHALIAGRAVTLADVGGDKYFGRVVADLRVDGASAGAILLAEGLARPYRGGRRESWCAFAER